ncbi:MAG: hypothetical protein ACREQ7_01570 [Candidatus Binatia bacterium]
MKAVRASLAGDSRTCPHCKATILKSSVSCPLCRHVLRFVSVGTDPRSNSTTCPLLVEGTIDHSGNGEALEYSILMEVHDENGKLVSRQTVGVGALYPAEKRIFSVRVEVSSPSLPV